MWIIWINWSLTMNEVYVEYLILTIVIIKYSTCWEAIILKNITLVN